MMEVRKADGEGTVARTRGNDEVAPIRAIRRREICGVQSADLFMPTRWQLVEFVYQFPATGIPKKFRIRSKTSASLLM